MFHDYFENVNSTNDAINVKASLEASLEVYFWLRALSYCLKGLCAGCYSRIKRGRFQPQLLPQEGATISSFCKEQRPWISVMYNSRLILSKESRCFCEQTKSSRATSEVTLEQFVTGLKIQGEHCSYFQCYGQREAVLSFYCACI